PSTLGVADTSPWVVNAHFTAKVETLPALIDFSAFWNRLLLRSWPADGHNPSPESARTGTDTAMNAKAQTMHKPDCQTARIVITHLHWWSEDESNRAAGRTADGQEIRAFQTEPCREGIA